MLGAFHAAAPVPVRRMLGIGGSPPAQLPADARWRESAHPVPDQRSGEAAREALALAAGAGDRDLLVVLLSGGASSMMALPADGITLAEKRQTSAELLQLGAEIHVLNTVRKHISGIKGGQLAAANRGATLTLALSDVVDDDPSAIGSGPSVADETMFADALAALDRYGGGGGWRRGRPARLPRRPSRATLGSRGRRRASLAAGARRWPARARPRRGSAIPCA